MTPREWWLLFDFHVGEKRYGDLTETEVEELSDFLDQAIEEHRKNG